jgi:predicted dehydrogenase
MIRFDNGTVLHVEASFSLNIKAGRGEIELFGTRAGAKLDPKLEIFSEINDYMVNVDFADDTALSFTGLFEKEVHHFVDCVLGRATCVAPAEDGVVLMRILDAIYKSAATGHEVRL